MNTNKHTPGPWTAHEYTKNSLGYKNGKAYHITSDDKTPAFQVLKSETFDYRAGVTGHFWDPSAKAKDRANAALIAAAPDLLAALERVLECHRLKISLDTNAGAVEQARAAIAKAKGE